MKIYVVRLNPDTREHGQYSKYPTKSEYNKIHSESPMNGFHEAVNFLSERGTVRGYLPPRHSASLRDGNPFCLITITAKTAKEAQDRIVGIQVGCVYSGEVNRLNLSSDKNAPDLLCHYSCADTMSLLFSKSLSNARETILHDEIQWIRGPVKEINIGALERVLSHPDLSNLHNHEVQKLSTISSFVTGKLSSDDEAFLDTSAFQNEVLNKLRKKKKPKGNQAPSLREVTAYQYARDPAIVAFALNRAKGVCEQCKHDAPFISSSTGLPYLEVHHVIPLKDGGSDTVENVKALCPNCHREAHYG
ncbi:HNH endonuclease [Vibrio parahaemolyticus]|uniref:HNH endonuclease n=6 Tax=Vibrio TaxID=662 RepID=UPI0009846302|nr:HNH endonuclease signature motif containing protein [Vibrio parahaemolyticus]OOH98549.1 hypothetical protein BIW15_23370 [Vibrio sp. SALL6]EGS6501262.1 HNH endonuclease [Vibrio parahaemolyticus]MDF4593002.1 HNH endonuclease signature motif containing protein [Vibrio parahaemolyticus]TOE08688.1 HNH endonuclease [Vibrio parahaemolyticus]TOJ02276.1 HNH endonuclease [Vibrio parahaemolyticus]